MKKLTLLGMAAMILGVAASTVACGGQEKAISLWVGNEEGVVSFYQSKVDAFLQANPDFPYKVKITGTDLGSIAGSILKDPSACADIYSVAHDNVGKLAQNGCASASGPSTASPTKRSPAGPASVNSPCASCSRKRAVN